MTAHLKISANLSDISNPYSGILLDAYGVFWNGNEKGLFAGCKEMMQKFVKSNKIVGILSNSTQLVENEKNKFQKHGLICGEHFHFLLTSGEVTKKVLTKKQLPFKITQAKYWLFGGIHPKFSSPHTLFETSPYQQTENIEEADFIYISIPHINGEDQINPEVFRSQLVDLKKFNLPMVCANPDHFAHEGMPPKLVVRQGSIAAIYEEIGGEVYYIGKPNSLVYEQAMKEFNQWGILQPQSILMVGDTPETDIKGAKKFGMASALVTQTGIMSERLSQQDFSYFVENLVTENQPNYFIQRMAHLDV